MRHVPFHGMAIIQTIGTRTPCKGGYYEQRDEELIHDGVLFNDHAISRSHSWLKRYHVQ
ncbi:hypothetical protein ANFP_11080 [Acidithiobacillus ferrooxidans]|nr:hypothetical protein ANFP_11080 [Acidithiobacillus ferrooxidans]